MVSVVTALSLNPRLLLCYKLHGEIFIFMHYGSVSLFFLGSSIFLAWWCLCLLSLPSCCLFICLFRGFLTPSSLPLCTWNSAEWWKSWDKAKPQNRCQWPGHHGRGIQTVRLFMPAFSCSILPSMLLRIAFAVRTPSWNFLLQTCSCEKGWQIRCILQ